MDSYTVDSTHDARHRPAWLTEAISRRQVDAMPIGDLRVQTANGDEIARPGDVVTRDSDGRLSVVAKPSQ